jgi:hypothetical protein
VSGPVATLREYAVIADGRRGALIGPAGDIVWLCAPSWESDAVFSALHGGRSSFAITPRGRFTWGGHYEPSSLVWRCRWVTEDGIVECRDALARPSEAGRVVILRRILAVAGDARVDVTLQPRAGFDQDPFTVRREDDGSWAGRTGGLAVRLWGAPGLHAADAPGGHRLEGEITVPAGRHHDVVLAIGDEAGGAPDADRLWRTTEEACRAAVPDPGPVVAATDARHALAVLDGLTHPGGGIVAAATLGLPERAREGRSYDYRYAWIRDGCYTGRAAARVGAYALLDRIVRWTAERVLADGPALMPAYTVGGDPVPRERDLPLPGFPGGTPIAGNRVVDQFQLDGFGEVLELFAVAAAAGRLDADGAHAAAVAAEAIARRWHEPDAGIWEIDDRRWTHSRLICAAGLRAVAALDRTSAPDARRWTDLAARMERGTAGTSVFGRRWGRAPDDPRVDAALLLPIVRDGLRARDPLADATVGAIVRDLSEDGYVYRFRHDDRPLGETEGAFLLCGFVMALAAHRRGDDVSAARWFERPRGACGSPRLFAEEWDVGQRQLRGNLPQAFVHALLLECAHVLRGIRFPGGGHAGGAEAGGDRRVGQGEAPPPA